MSRIRLNREQRMVAAAMAVIPTYQHGRVINLGEGVRLSRVIRARKFRRAVHYYRRFFVRRAA